MEGYKVTNLITKKEEFFTSNYVAEKFYGKERWEGLKVGSYKPWLMKVEKILPSEMWDDDMDARR